MARRTKGPYSIYSDRDVAFINARIAGRRIRESLGVEYPTDPDRRSAAHVRAAEEAAKERYAQLVAGRVLDGREARIMTAFTLPELIALFFVEAEKTWPKSFKTRVIHLRTIESFVADDFRSFAPDAPEGAPRFWAADARTPLERLVADDGPHRFAIERHQGAIRSTYRKEASSLFAFFAWAKRDGHLASLPPRPQLPRSLRGRRTGTQRATPVAITRDEALRILDALPEWAAKGGRGAKTADSRGAFRVRDFARLGNETSLRPSTIERLSVPEHWTPGQRFLEVTEDIDKAGNARRVPLSAVAFDIMTRAAPAEGLVFGRHDFRTHIKRAAAKVLPPAKAKDFARYDFRHGAAIFMLSSSGNNLLGVGHMLGHTQMTTTNKYLRTSEAHAAEVLDSVSKRSVTLCEGRDLNPHESNPASTSSERVWRFLGEFEDLPTPADAVSPQEVSADGTSRSAVGQHALVRDAVALLRAAAARDAEESHRLAALLRGESLYRAIEIAEAIVRATLADRAEAGVARG